MNLLEILRFAVRGLTANKLRSALTTLGITIGVAAVILLVAVGNGASAAIAASIQGLGTNVVNVSPARGGGQGATARPLTVQDAHALVDPVGAPDVKAASPVVNTTATATYGQTSYDISSVAGTEPAYFSTTNRELAQGQLFTGEDVTAARKVVVLGPTTAQSIFGTADPVGKNVLLNSIQFTVIGVLQAKGSTGLQNADDVAIAPISAVQNSLAGYGSLSQIAVQATSADSVSLAQSEITAILNARHGIRLGGTPDYQIQNSEQLLATRTSATETFTVLLAAVAAISLLVGGIGVTNIMLVTVTERIREIGIRKAIGAPRAAILGQFLAEATMLSLFGGLLGVAIGLIGSRFTISGIKPVVVPSSILLAFAVSALIGLFFGSFPANRAAKLRPIDALRHE
ncbi:peptide ABC transporter permease [Amycolatopsis mediterranei S699]|uniref:Permease component of ABC-type antimicrobial peptide transport system n=2 Tax=Amycolatopsis mediterranei TaxID=33910 RepID=A0A0H3CUM6_AMYMU|nr:ABC transporter permease [Amycolatopsis mediterranei]ADJ42312.1 permease component of ABC-type antimicrobial peptide transport system [Amycolatopsis mediterranei U32]AEK38996.1 peptide ABC transporter permease [Amycolatopsis mediterranei S699]AFO74026.1 peptide ABC transporter permease [Amycolatopsis mediterranei S699]AGT81155.1 peptide ABC transporter permease [Amycolatopsis mediterranei RB]KDO09780.1 macrolide ABC transporter permease [Amycolatopsis mediterranei]